MNVMNDREETCPPSHRVVERVADEVGTEPTQLEPLYSSIDPDALDTLFADSTGATGSGVVELTFRYAGYRIVVAQDRSVEVDPAT